MPDSRFQQAERGVQHSLSKSSLFSYLAIICIILAAHSSLRSNPNRADGPDAAAAVRYTHVHFDPAGFAPLRLAGAWRVEVADPRFGGLSALAVDGGRLLALTDSGTVIHLPKPDAAGPALIHDLPAGPGSPDFKFNRDSEALARNPAGGWWVGFENWNELWLYDYEFSRAVRRIELGKDHWPENRGVEAMIVEGNRLILFPENGDQWLEVGRGKIRSHPLVSDHGFTADAVHFPDGKLLLLTRQFGWTGIAKRLVAVEARKGRLELHSLADLGLNPTTNVEGIAAEPRADGGTRLWLVTDNDFRPRAPTLLVALDLP